MLAPFRVTMTADKTIAPVQLANGNLIETGDIDGGLHYAVWDDPFPKPSYLFAMVGGDLGSIHDEFTTSSGRTVKLGVYCSHGKEEECLWAMDFAQALDGLGRAPLRPRNTTSTSSTSSPYRTSISARWRNKGLNIFNDRLVFVKPDSATDDNYESVERVIAHEYFHNWTGDRITCRDWFQLCLKEGLTVYRDQEFTSDERSRR